MASFTCELKLPNTHVIEVQLFVTAAHPPEGNKKHTKPGAAAAIDSCKLYGYGSEIDSCI